MNKEIWFSSDHHFGHENVIKYSNRPFQSVSEMERMLISNINNCVMPTDDFYLLGDFAFESAERIVSILNQINCKNIFYVLGNHDKQMRDPKVVRRLRSITNYQEISIQGQFIVLCHYPILEWNRGHRGAIMAHAHTHGNLKYPPSLMNKRITDVGVDCWNYCPVSFTQLKNLFKNSEDIKHHD